MKAISVQPISPIGYNVSINTQYRGNGSLPSARPSRGGAIHVDNADVTQNTFDTHNMAKNASHSHDQDPDDSGLVDLDGSGELTFNTKILASLGKDEGKELYERQKKQLCVDNQIGSGGVRISKERRITRRQSSGLNNQMIQLAE